MATFTTTNGVSYEITQEGLSAIYGDYNYASGGMYLWDGKNFHTLNSSQSFYTESFIIDKNNPVNNTSHYTTATDTILTKSLQVLNATGVLVTHTYTDITATYLYHFIDPNLQIKVEIDNRSDDIQITCPTIGGLVCTFNTPPSGIDYRYTQDQAINKLNPGNNTPTFCAYIKDEAWGISVSTIQPNSTRSLCHFDYLNTNAQKRVVEHYYRDTVWPQSKIQYRINICVGKNPTMTGLLGQYKLDIQNIASEPQYTMDNRKWIYKQTISNSGSTNPYRLLDTARLDTASGTITYVSGTVATLGNTGRGICIVDLGGYKERNELGYHLWPRLIEDNLFTLNETFQSGSKQCGLFSDFHFETVRQSWTTDTNMPLWSRDEIAQESVYKASNINWIKYKVYKLQDYDFDIFYSPNSGRCYECALLAPIVREILPDKSIYYGFGSDMSAPYVGFHTTAHYDNRWFTETPQYFFELMRWALGDVDVYVEMGNVSGSPPVNFYEYALSNQMSVWVTSSGQIPSVTGTQPTYVNTELSQFYTPFLFTNFVSTTMSISGNILDRQTNARELEIDPGYTHLGVYQTNTASGVFTNKAKTGLTTGLKSLSLTGDGYMNLITADSGINPASIMLSGYLQTNIVGINNSGVNIVSRQDIAFTPKSTYTYGVDGELTNQSFSFASSIDLTGVMHTNGYSGLVNEVNNTVMLHSNLSVPSGIASVVYDNLTLNGIHL